MSTINNFADMVIKVITKKHPGLVGSVSVTDVTKNNGVTKKALVIRSKDSNIAPTMYLEAYYEEFTNGEKTIDEVADKIFEVYESCKTPNFDFDADDYLDFNKVKNNLCLKLVNADTNRKMLEDAPHFRYGDLAVLFMVQVGGGTITVRNSHFKLWNVSKEDLLAYAKENFAKNPVFIAGMAEIARGMLNLNSEQKETFEEVDDVMFIMSNKSRIFGSVGLLLKEKIHAFAEKKDMNFFIIPSSVHELVLLPDFGGVDLDDLKGMIYAVNRTQLEPVDFLSDNVYYYDRTTQVLSVAGTDEELILKDE